MAAAAVTPVAAGYAVLSATTPAIHPLDAIPNTNASSRGDAFTCDNLLPI